VKAAKESRTPGPWKAWDRGFGWEIHGPDDEAINRGFRETFSREDAELIAEAVNSRRLDTAAPDLDAGLAALVAVLRKARQDNPEAFAEFVNEVCDPHALSDAFSMCEKALCRAMDMKFEPDSLEGGLKL
jgi:hypothetical protein